MEEVTNLEKVQLPYGKEVQFQQIKYDNGFTMLRLRFKEGKRFTMVDLDPETVDSWRRILADWSANQAQD